MPTGRPENPLRHLRYLSLKEVMELVPYSAMQIYRLEKAGHFPQRRQIGPARVGWLANEIEAWLMDRPVVVLKSDTPEDAPIPPPQHVSPREQKEFPF